MKIEQTSEAAGAMAEVAKVRETAQRLADGDYPEEADHIRVLAGMIGQLAEQVERLGQQASAPSARDAEALVEEDRTPERAPAQPMNDRAET
jgi:hypothetical protein